MKYAYALLALWASQAALAAAPAQINIPGQRLFPESLTSSADGAVYIGSIGARTIFRAAPGAATAAVWVAPGADAPAGYLGVFADDRSHTLWACSLPQATAAGVAAVPATLHAYDPLICRCCDSRRAALRWKSGPRARPLALRLR